MKTFELELDFAEYIQHTDVRIADLCWPPIYYLPGIVISATVALVYINVQPTHDNSRSSKKIELGALSSPAL